MSIIEEFIDHIFRERDSAIAIITKIAIRIHDEFSDLNLVH